ncbi:hypothetical protein GCM10023338_08050 [Wohlfahrtiimonas larvae]|uniref:Uncharacterized protein n=1 Tax=Wohlfahrtiimonas larvae TaxID=1157986 RepID=A0ABP9MLW6_9GAMM
MKNFLYLIVTGAIFPLYACSDSNESANRHYAVEQKKQLEVQLNQSLDRNMEKLESQNEY